MATFEEVRQRIGEDLGLVPIGQDLEYQDQVRIDAGMVEAHTRLKNRGLATWASSGDVPSDLVPYFSLMVCQKLLTSYSVPEARYTRIITDAGPDGMNAIKEIALLAFPAYEALDSPADY